MSTQRILFLGNSYTYCNELPTMLAQLAAAGGKDVDVHQVTAGGVTLEWHAQNEATLAALYEAWDFVVLQEHSIRPIQDTPRMSIAAAVLHQIIASIGAQTVLFMTWARQHFPEMQAGLARVYTEIAQEIGARVAPVGLAWEAALAADPSLALYTEDKSHPTPLGSYLAACVFYATFFGESSVGLPAKLTTAGGEVLVEIPEAQARLFQSVAWDVVQKHS
ncbi:MAG: SGNH/GDSL hydrolase family protein [Anaerolineae bacterium]|nr:SGNH/GDSL hydrolase family protein [Anaerolineae bacterium]